MLDLIGQSRGRASPLRGTFILLWRFLDGDADYLGTVLKLLERVHSLYQQAEDAMLAVEVRLRPVADEELAAVGLGSGVGHGQRARDVLELGTELVGELVARAAAAGAGGVTTLRHEVGDHAVKRRAVIEAVAGQEDEVVHGHRCVGGEQIQNQCSGGCLHGGGVAFGGIDGHGWRCSVFLHVISNLQMRGYFMHDAVSTSISSCGVLSSVSIHHPTPCNPPDLGDIKKN